MGWNLFKALQYTLTMTYDNNDEAYRIRMIELPNCVGCGTCYMDAFNDAMGSLYALLRHRYFEGKVIPNFNLLTDDEVEFYFTEE